MKKTNFLCRAITYSAISLLSLGANVSYAASDKYSPSTQSTVSLVDTKIVGGDVAEQQNWPWMTAYVLTFQNINTSLVVDNINYNTRTFSGNTPNGTVSADIASCGDGQQTCENVQNKICLIERGTITFAAKALNCESSGGSGVIIYNNVDGSISGTVGSGFNGTIPLVAITQADGLELLDKLGQGAPVRASLSVAPTGPIAQDSSCGASFLGNKWVITAAHCVDSPRAMQFKMNVGEYDLSDGAQNAIGIANIYIHPEYDEDAINNDIAIVELTEQVNAPAVQLADEATTRQFTLGNLPATVAGWGGRTGYVSGEGPTSNFPDILHRVELSLITNEVCQQRNRTAANITDAMICASSSEQRGSCQGDSGGPLVINTNTGIQQVGIVSFGVGCADPNFPGVYTRVAKFTDWLDAISEGIAIDQLQDFGVVPTDLTISSVLRVANNSSQSTTVSFTIEGDDEFSIDSTSCSTLAPDASCELTVSFKTQSAGEHEAKILITSSNTNVQSSYSQLYGFGVTEANSLSGIAGPANDRVTWYSGGDSLWRSNSIAGVESGTIGNLQDSILLALIEGPGQVSFEWGVSSEENTDDPADPFDILALSINGEQVEFISGELEVTNFVDNQGQLELPSGLHTLAWTYSKDPATEEGQDKGFVRNVVFAGEPIPVPTPTPNPAPEPTPTPNPLPTNSSSGGGSITWWLLILASGTILRRRS